MTTFAALVLVIVAVTSPLPCNAFAPLQALVGRAKMGPGEPLVTCSNAVAPMLSSCAAKPTSHCRPSNSKTMVPSVPSGFPSSSCRSSSTQLSLVSSATAVRLAETVAPKLGILTAFLLFLAPAAAVKETVQSNQLCDLNPLPIALMSVVTTSWLAYGLAVQDFYVAMSNLPGALLSVSYVVGILPVMQVAHSGTAGRSPDRRELRAVQLLLAFGATASLSLWTALRFGGASIAKSKTILGLFASAFTVLLFGSPLSTVQTVVKEKNSASILGRLTVAQIINASLWTAYGVTLRQVFVAVPNGIGLALGLVQLGLKFLYPSNPVCELPDDNDFDFSTNQTVPVGDLEQVPS